MSAYPLTGASLQRSLTRSRAELENALEGAKAAGIRNIVALRGDPPAGEEKWEVTEGGFACALDLVKYIREKYGDLFGISVAGYPVCGRACAAFELGDADCLGVYRGCVVCRRGTRRSSTRLRRAASCPRRSAAAS